MQRNDEKFEVNQDPKHQMGLPEHKKGDAKSPQRKSRKLDQGFINKAKRRRRLRGEIPQGTLRRAQHSIGRY